MKNFFSKLIEFWNEDRSLTFLMILLFLFVFFFIPMLGPGKGGQVVIKLVYSIMLITSVLSVAKSRKYIFLVAVFGVIGFVVNWLGQLWDTDTIQIIQDFSITIFNLVFAFVVLIKTFKPGDITYQRIEGSIIVYLLVGMVFAYVLHALYLICGPSSFNNVKPENDMKDFLYFSFTSLTTMGYGDITPVHPLARSIANLEALIGQLYPAILIARLVSLEIEASARKRAGK